MVKIKFKNQGIKWNLQMGKNLIWKQLCEQHQNLLFQFPHQLEILLGLWIETCLDSGRIGCKYTKVNLAEHKPVLSGFTDFSKASLRDSHSIWDCLSNDSTFSFSAINVSWRKDSIVEEEMNKVNLFLQIALIGLSQGLGISLEVEQIQLEAIRNHCFQLIDLEL